MGKGEDRTGYLASLRAAARLTPVGDGTEAGSQVRAAGELLLVFVVAVADPVSILEKLSGGFLAPPGGGHGLDGPVAPLVH